MAKKMLLMDPKQLPSTMSAPPVMRVTTVPPVPDAVTDRVLKLDRDMETILNRRGANLQEKWKEYDQVLRNYLHYVTQYKERHGLEERQGLLPPSPTEQEEEEREQDTEPTSPRVAFGPMERETLSSIPVKLKPKAYRLLSYLKKMPHMGWTDRGELKVDGQTISDSHMIDLVNDLIRPRRTTLPTPTGWEAFAQALKRGNLPRELIGNLPRRRWFDVPRRVHTTFAAEIPTFEASSSSVTPILRRGVKRLRKSSPITQKKSTRDRDAATDWLSL